MLPAEWRRTDEWYVYNRNPRDRVKVLASLDDSTIKGATMNGDHPIAWYHEFQGGRSWYTGGGHTSESFSEELFRKHLEGGILWAAGAAEEAPGVPNSASNGPAAKDEAPPRATPVPESAG
jgi:type 1 glutamine amidotransferase